MTLSQTRDAQRVELQRLLQGLEYYRSWRIAAIEHANGTVTQEDLNQIVEPGATFLEMFDATKGKRCASILKEVQQWYAHTASDLIYRANSGNTALTTAIESFFSAFRADLGFDFLAESEFLKTAADKALKAGKIANQETYYALKELENDLSQSVLSATEMDLVSALLRKFEV